MGDKERGGLNPSCPAARQQQQQQPVTPRGLHTPPTTAWGGRQPGGPCSAATPHVWGSRRGDQQQQQQHATAALPLDPARHAHALNLYREHVRAGFWARVTFEQLPDGEHVSLLFRPMAAATAAAGAQSKKNRRRQNKKRQEKRLRWCQARDSRTAAAATPVQQLRVVAGPAPRQQLLVNPSRQQPLSSLTLSAGPAAAATADAAPALAAAAAAAATPAAAATVSFAAAAAPEAAADAATPAVRGNMPAPLHPARSRALEHVSRETRSSSKRKKIDSQEDTAHTIPQLDGADLESSPAPLPPPPPCHVGSPSAPTCSPSDAGVGSPTSPPDEPSTSATSPPLPTPRWTADLPPHLTICKTCLVGCHGPNYNSCMSCSFKRTSR